MWSAATVVIHVELATWGLSRRSVTMASMNGRAKPGRVAMIWLIWSWSNCSRPSPVTSAPMPSAPAAVSGLLKSEIPPVPCSAVLQHQRPRGVGAGDLEADVMCVVGGGEAEVVQQHPGQQHLDVDLQAPGCGEQQRELEAALAVLHQKRRRAGPQQLLDRLGQLGAGRWWPDRRADTAPHRRVGSPVVEADPDDHATGGHRRSRDEGTAGHRRLGGRHDALLLLVGSPARGGPAPHPLWEGPRRAASGKKDDLGLYLANMGLHHVVTLLLDDCVLLDVAIRCTSSATTVTAATGSPWPATTAARCAPRPGWSSRPRQACARSPPPTPSSCPATRRCCAPPRPRCWRACGRPPGGSAAAVDLHRGLRARPCRLARRPPRHHPLGPGGPTR